MCARHFSCSGREECVGEYMHGLRVRVRSYHN